MPPNYPYPGCIVEYLEDNSIHIAMVVEDSGGKLRLLLPGRREVKLSANRVLPWIGPVHPAGLTKDEIVKVLEKHKTTREEKSAQIPALEIWELAQGEISRAPADWFAELMESEPDIDTIAAYGRALLACKTHFRFQPPEFQVYDAETVNKRAAEQKARLEKEELVNKGAAFLKMLWDIASRKRTDLDLSVIPEEELVERIKRMLFARMSNPDSSEDDSLWQTLARHLPEQPHLPLQLLIAWGMLPKHYNFWLDRADFAAGDEWWHECNEIVHKLYEKGVNPEGLSACDLPFISIDGASTVDIDDAFCIEETPAGWTLTLAFASPALSWPFEDCLDKLVARRATSIYLPEGDLHMLPLSLGTEAYSLHQGQTRPAFCIRLELDSQGACHKCEPFIASVKLAANLRYNDVQDVIAGGQSEASPFRKQLMAAHKAALAREKLRIAQGAVVMLRQEPEIILTDEGGETLVAIEPEIPARDAQRLVSEMMILASAAIADWAYDCGVPLLYRTQNVGLPKEYAGIWNNPADLSRIMHSLIPSSLEINPRPHAALGLSRYAQVTSPLRRYPDLINEAQIINFLQTGTPKWDEADLSAILDIISPALDAAGHVQRNRPRYWKLLYLRQQGDSAWYDGIVCEENENFVTVSLPVYNLVVRGRRNVFDERTSPGLPVRIRLGKINPLYNEIHILEAISAEE